MNETQPAYLNNITVQNICFSHTYLIRILVMVYLEFRRSVARVLVMRVYDCRFFTLQYKQITGTAYARCSRMPRKRKKKKKKREGMHDSMHSQRKCKFTSTVAGGMHPAGSKNSPRCYCSLVACPTYNSYLLNGEFLDLPILFCNAGRSSWVSWWNVRILALPIGISTEIVWGRDAW